MSELSEKENEFNNQISKLGEIGNRISELNSKQDFENLEWKEEIKNNFIEFLKICKPVFIFVLEDARTLRVDIERKNRVLEDVLHNDDYNEYLKIKEELSDINGNRLNNNLSILETYISVIHSCFGLLNSISCFLPQEYSMYSDKIYKLTSVIDEIEEISYMR